MKPQTFARAIVSIEENYGLRLDARSAWLRLDEFKKVKELKGGKCNEAKGWYGLKGACKRGKKGEGDARSKESKLEIADRIKKRKSDVIGSGIQGQKSQEENLGSAKAGQTRKIDYEVKRSVPFDIESILSGKAQPNEEAVSSILKTGQQSEIPVVLIKGKPGSEIEAEVHSGSIAVASYREAARRNPDLKGRMDVIAVSTKEEAIVASNQQSLIDRHSKGREPIKESRILDIESFKTKASAKDFKEKDIEELAKSIAEIGGIYQGPQVRQSALEEWTTRSKSDDFAVLAYRRAQEINPQLKGRIMAQFV